MPTLTTTIQHSWIALATAIKEEKEVRGIQIGKEVKLSLFADNMILYIENPENTARKLLELINECSKVAGYKINTEKSLAFEKTEREIKETIPFTIAYLIYMKSTSCKMLGWMKHKEKEVTQSCPTLCDPMDSSLPGSSIHGILQARILEWVAISFSKDRTQVSRIAGRRFNLWATRKAHDQSR